MKIILTLVLVVFWVTSFGQVKKSLSAPQIFFKGKDITHQSLKSQRNENLVRLTLYLVSVGLDASGDALYDQGDKELGKLLQAASVASLIAIPVFTDLDKKDWGKWGVAAVLLRFSIFDPTYNLSRGLPIDHRGTTSYYDHALKGIPEGHLWLPRSVAFIGGVTLMFEL